MFPGHPFLQQEKRRAEFQGEHTERERVLRLIHMRRQRLIGQYRAEQRKGGEPNFVRTMLNDNIEMLDELHRAVRQGHQR